MPDKLSAYHAKRDFNITPEPKGKIVVPAERLRFVVQKHDARKLHYDFRLELDGTLKSWAVPKGPSLDPGEKRLAVHVEDHPLGYIGFEGDIPEHQYGAGHVDVWDTGYWEPQGDPAAGYRAGKLKFHLDGEKLQGGWTLVRTRLQGSGNKEQWLLIKERDDNARSSDDFDITEEMPDSVLSKSSTKTSKLTAKRAMHISDGDDQAVTSKARSTVAKTAGKKSRTGTALDLSEVDNAVKSPLPEMLVPQLATLVDTVPEEGHWIYEIKFDGYRVLARISNGKAHFFTRDGKDWTAKLPQHAKAIEALGIKSGWFDGEIVVLDKHGVPSFQLLQNAFDEKSTAQILFFLFDLPYLNGYDLRRAPLTQRRALLQHLLQNASDGPLRFSAAMEEPPQKLLDSACQLSMEGVIGKLRDSPYVGKRSTDWIKLKCRQRQEFVIVGYTEPQGARKFFGSLLLAVYADDGSLRYAGRVGTGFDRMTLHSTYKQLKPLEQKSCPFPEWPSGVGRAQTHWVKPQLVAEISFAEWTRDGMLRQAVFHGLRVDKPADQVRREEAVSAPVKERKRATRSASISANSTKDNTVQGIKITHPERVIDPSIGLTKLDLVLYYDQVSSSMLPFLKNRPVYLLRSQEGLNGKQFFQRHSNRLAIPGIGTLDRSLDPAHAPLMVIDTAHALIGAAQMGTIELHTCNATADKIDRPDCMVFDLDPDPDLPWSSVIEGAQLTKVVLDELGLKSFLKTSGGKGLHIVVPLARRHTWDEVTEFSEAVAQHLARTVPAHFSAKMGAKNRVGKIYVDYMRNQRQASTVVPYSARARPGLAVATPIAWEELSDTTGAAMWTIATLPERLARLKNDPWSDYFKTRQMLTVAMKKKLGISKK
jgi:bifunctional non-homologous end joining protein LigD